MNKLSILTLIFAIILLGALTIKKAKSTGDYTYSTEKIASEIANDSTNIIIVDIKDINTVINDQEQYQLIDLRKKEAFDIGHIPNAINLPISEINSKGAISNLCDEKINILYADDYSLASNIAIYLKQTGFDNVKYLQANFKDAENFIKNPNSKINSNQETAKYEYNKFFNQSQKKTKPKMLIPTAPKVKRASGGC